MDTSPLDSDDLIFHFLRFVLSGEVLVSLYEPVAGDRAASSGQKQLLSGLYKEGEITGNGHLDRTMCTSQRTENLLFGLPPSSTLRMTGPTSDPSTMRKTTCCNFVTPRATQLHDPTPALRFVV